MHFWTQNTTWTRYAVHVDPTTQDTNSKLLARMIGQ